MDLLEYVAMQMKKGKKPKQIRQLLVQNGYPVYEVENVLAKVDTQKEDKKQPLKVSVKLNAPSYVIIFILAVVLLVAGIVVLILYLV